MQGSELIVTSRRSDIVANAVPLPAVAQLLRGNTSVVAVAAVDLLTQAPVAVLFVVVTAAEGT